MLTSSSCLYITFLFLSIINLSEQVSVLLGGTLVQWRLAIFSILCGSIESWHAGCKDLRPGECCSIPPGSFIDPGMMIAEDLQPLDIAFLWQTRRVSWLQRADACSGTPFRSHVGGSQWKYTWNTQEPSGEQEDTAITGVSYIRLPPKVPLDPSEVDWLATEGMRGLVWGGGKWFANQVGYPLSTKTVLRQRKREFDVHGPQISNNMALFKGGTFYATAPPRQRRVDWMAINGTNYTHHGSNDPVYANDAGIVLDLNTTLAC